MGLGTVEGEHAGSPSHPEGCVQEQSKQLHGGDDSLLRRGPLMRRRQAQAPHERSAGLLVQD